MKRKMYRLLIHVGCYFTNVKKRKIMAKRKNEPIKVMVNGKKRTITGKRAYPQNLLEAFERIIDEAKDSELSEDFFITVGLDIRFIPLFLK